MWVMLKTRANMTDCVYWLESVGCSGKDLLLCDPGSYAAQWKMGCCCYAIPSDTMQYYRRIPYNTTEYQVKAHNTMQYQAIALNTLQYHVIWRNPGCCAAQSRTKCCSCRGGGQRLRQRWLHWEGRRAPASPRSTLTTTADNCSSQFKISFDFGRSQQLLLLLSQSGGELWEVSWLLSIHVLVCRTLVNIYLQQHGEQADEEEGEVLAEDRRGGDSEGPGLCEEGACAWFSNRGTACPSKESSASNTRERRRDTRPDQRRDTRPRKAADPHRGDPNVSEWVARCGTSETK